MEHLGVFEGFFFFLAGGGGSGTQGFTLAKQPLYRLSHISSPGSSLLVFGVLGLPEVGIKTRALHSLVKHSTLSYIPSSQKLNI
jgi:hypothetical protein